MAAGAQVNGRIARQVDEPPRELPSPNMLDEGVAA